MAKRKKYFIDKKFQSKFIFSVVLIIVGAIITSGILSYTIAVHMESKNSRKLYGARIESQDDLIVVERLLVLKPVVIRYLLIAGLLSIILASVSILFYSHRIAGPMYRLHKHLRDIIDGNYNVKLRFRKNDEFKHLADAINELQDKLMEREKS